MSATKRASGGARAAQRKREAAQAARLRDDTYRARREAGRALVGEIPTAPREMFAWLARLLAWLIDDCVNDPGLPPERQREQAARLGQALAKALPSADLANDLREFKKVLDDMNGPPHANDDQGTLS